MAGSPPPRGTSGTCSREEGPGGDPWSVTTASAPQVMAYFIETLCLGLANKTMQEGTGKSPLKGHLAWLCGIVFGENEH